MNISTKLFITSGVCAAALAAALLSCGESSENKGGLNEKEALGKLVFFDASLSEPEGESCATCHATDKGFADESSRIVSEGAVKGLFSQRNSMSVCYLGYAPPLHYDNEDSTYVGGLFWDGRSNSLQEQAGAPFVNPVEMGNPDNNALAEKIKRARYYKKLVRLYGPADDPDSIVAHVTDALAAYQMSDEVNPFSSKYDLYLEGKSELTPDEARGLELFEDVNKGTCASCHSIDKNSDGKVLFTDFTYDNLGIPKNPDNPNYKVPCEYFLFSPDSLDLGLGAIVKKEEENGKFRVPTLRNIALTAPYGHNGYFKTLEDIVHFYNVRDAGDEYPSAEYPQTVNKSELGDLKLSAEEERQIVLFLETLSDGFAKRK